jgi:endonuclease-8
VPEGDTIYRAARALNAALRGQTVIEFESVYPAVTRIAEDRPIVGRTIEDVSARGKHLLIAFSSDLVLRTHMRMNGSWHLYKPGARWRRPARDMRVLIATKNAVAVGFNVPVAELLTARQLTRHAELSALGPDLLGAAFHADEVVRRARAHPHAAIADMLVNQRVVAGIGNVFKAEILFLAGIHPFTPISVLGDDDIRRVVAIAREQLAANVMTRAQTLRPSTGRTTTNSSDPNSRLWVYGRAGKRCRRCGATIQARKAGLDARLTYWCALCQPAQVPRQ